MSLKQKEIISNLKFTKISIRPNKPTIKLICLFIANLVYLPSRLHNLPNINATAI